MRYIESHSFYIQRDVLTQDIFVFEDSVFCVCGNEQKNTLGIKIDEYILDYAVTPKKLRNELNLLQPQQFCSCVLLKLLSNIRTIGLFDKNGFSNLFLIKNNIDQDLIKINFCPNWYVGKDGFIKIKNYFFVVRISREVMLWHAGNKVFAIDSVSSGEK